MVDQKTGGYGEIAAFWDESSKYVLIQHTEPTQLQRLALQLADRGAQAVENNERMVDQKTGGYGFKDEVQRGKDSARAVQWVQSQMIAEKERVRVAARGPCQ